MLVTERGAANRQLIILKREDGSHEAIPFQSTRFAVAVKETPRNLVALDEAGKAIGPARGEMRDGLFFITPVKDAVSYRWVESAASPPASPPGPIQPQMPQH